MRDIISFYHTPGDLINYYSLILGPIFKDIKIDIKKL